MANVRNFKKLGLQDPKLQKLQTNIKQVLQPIVNCEIINGKLIKNIELIAGRRNEIPHGLDREPLGFLIVRQRQDSRIWDLQDSNPGPKNTFTIACSHDVEVDVWIF